MSAGISSDSQSVKLKAYLLDMVKKDVPLKDYGVHDSLEEMVQEAASVLSEFKIQYFIFVTENGMGPALHANKLPQLRCIPGWSDEQVEQARKEVDANCLSFASSDTKGFAAISMLKRFVAEQATQPGRELGTLMEKTCRDEQKTKAAAAKFMTKVGGGSLSFKLQKQEPEQQAQQPGTKALSTFNQGYNDDQAARVLIEKVRGEQQAGIRQDDTKLTLEQKLSGALAGGTETKTTKELEVPMYVQQPGQQKQLSLAERLAGGLKNAPAMAPAPQRLVQPAELKTQAQIMEQAPVIQLPQPPEIQLPIQIAPVEEKKPEKPQQSLAQRLQAAQAAQAQKTAQPVQQQQPGPGDMGAARKTYNLRPAVSAPSKYDITAYKGYLRDNEDDIRGLVKEMRQMKELLTPDMLAQIYNDHHGERLPNDAFQGDPIVLLRKYYDMDMRARLCRTVDFISTLQSTAADVLGALTCEEEICKTFKPTDQGWLQQLYGALK